MTRIVVWIGRKQKSRLAVAVATLLARNQLLKKTPEGPFVSAQWRPALRAYPKDSIFFLKRAAYRQCVALIILSSQPMAIRSCRECGGAVSGKAKLCPHCGASNAKTIRPIFVYVLIAAILLPVIFPDDTSDRERISAVASKPPDQQPSAPGQMDQTNMPLPVRIKLVSEAMTDMKVSSLSDDKDWDKAKLILEVFNFCVETIRQAEREKLSPDMRVELIKAKRLLIQRQREAFPIMRKSAAKLARNALWVNDVEVGINGKGNQNIEFFSYRFTTNKNIASAHEILFPTFMMARFKNACFAWYERATKKYCYVINSPSDSELVVLTEEGLIR